MKTIQLNDNPHDFQKQNLVTITTKKGSYDIMKCSICGMEGKTTSLATMQVRNSYSDNRINNCKLTKKQLKSGNKDKKVRIFSCTASWAEREGLTPNSEHTIIETPANERIDSNGVWVNGLTMPVKLLNNEFNYID